jgi:serine protease Do
MRSFPQSVVTALLGAGWFLTPGLVHGQPQRGARPPDALHQLNDAVEALVQRVSPSIVQVVVSGYGSAEGGNRGQANDVIGRRQAIGSGVVVDPDGYIVTNAHVVTGAQKIEVIVPPRFAPGAASDAEQDAQGTRYEGRVVGTTKELDLAVIKIEAHGLIAIPITGTIAPARQGEVVFAFGSPEGLRNTVTMGVVSAAERQPDPESPRVYVQTDAPIDPGNSGGALVDADGRLVGINTFIMSSSGGNEGLGFAIPAQVVAYAYPQLVKYGHIHQLVIGALVQTITPELATGLHLARDHGIIVSDVTPGGPADSAGLGIQDIILRVDGVPVGSLPLFAHGISLHKSGEQLQVEVLRGSDRVTLQISLMERPHREDSLVELADPTKNLVRRLSILGVELDSTLVRKLPELRSPSGVVVAARTLGAGTDEIPLQVADVIHGMNGTPITTLDGLRAALATKRPGDAVVLQIERFGQLVYVAFTLR